MRICLYTEGYVRGGIDTFIVSLINGWPNNLDEFVILVNEEYPESSALLEKIERKVELLKYKNYSTTMNYRFMVEATLEKRSIARNLFNKFQVILESFTIFPWIVFQNARWLRKSSLDRLLVINGGYPGGLSCRSALLGWKLAGKRPLGVLSFHNYSVKPRFPRILVELPLDYLVSKSVGTIVSVSNGCLDSIKNRPFLGSFRNKKTIYNGIADPRDKATKLKAARGRSKCIMIGTLEKRKGHSFLLEAFRNILKSISNAELHIYGQGTSEEFLRIIQEIDDLGLKERVFLHPYEKEIIEKISSSSVLLVPSQAFESFGLTIIEAMSVGVPVVATDVGGIPEVLGNNVGGYVCSKDSSIQFADAAISVLRNQELAKEIGEQGRARFESLFINTVMSKEYEKILA
jgi:glycosyltransferase involved in cell wall biosynthesis